MTTAVRTGLLASTRTLVALLLAGLFAWHTGHAQELGREILANDDTSGGCPHVMPDVAFTADGHCLVVWCDYRHGDYDANIYCQCYDSSGAQIDTNRVINGDTESRNIWDYRQISPAIAALSNGGALACWEDYRRGTPSIYYRILDDQGCPAGPEHSVAAPADSEMDPDVAAIGSKSVVVWTQTRPGAAAMVRAALVNTSGDAGASFTVSDCTPAETCGSPAVAGFNSGFVVAWCQSSGSESVLLRWYDAHGTPRAPPTRIAFDSACRPRVASDSLGNAIVVWEEARPYPTGVWAQAYDSVGMSRSPILRESDSLGTWNYHPAIAAEPGGNFFAAGEDGRSGPPLVYGQLLDDRGGPVGVNFRVDGSPNLVAQGSPAVAIRSPQQYVAAWVDTREGYQCIYAADRGHRSSEILRVNSDHGSSIQDFVVVTIDSAGRVGSFWFDHVHDRGRDAGVHGQRFDELMQPVGSNFRVSDQTGAEAKFPWAATNASGTTVVVWEDDRNDDGDIYCQVFDARGNPRGTNFRVNDDSGLALQTDPSVSVNDSGYFVVAWNDTRTGPSAPFVQRFDPGGNRMGGNFQAAEACDLAAPLLLNSGDFWVTWNRSEIFARRYEVYRQSWDSAITVSDSSWHYCSCSRMMLVGGNSLWVVWMDTLHAGWNISARRLRLDGTPIGPSFRVNDDTVTCEHYLPFMAYDDCGRVIIEWRDARRVGNLDVRARMYDTSGLALADTSFIVNTDQGRNDDQWPWLGVAARNGHVIYGWSDNRRFRSWDTYIRSGAPTLPANPVHSGLAAWPSVVSTTCVLKPSFGIWGQATVTVFDVAGRLKYERSSFALSDQANSVEVDCRDFPQGVYFAVLKVGSVTFSGRIVVIH